MHQLIKLRRLDPQDRLFPADQPLAREIDGYSQRRIGGALAGSRLQDPKLPS